MKGQRWWHVTETKERKRKLEHIVWGCSEPAGAAAEAPRVWCARTERNDPVQRWHVYSRWAQASDLACRDCTLASGPSHLERLDFKSFRERGHWQCLKTPLSSQHLCLLSFLCLPNHHSFYFWHDSRVNTFAFDFPQTFILTVSGGLFTWLKRESQTPGKGIHL